MLFNNDTFYPNTEVKSLYLHDTRRVLQDTVVEGQAGFCRVRFHVLLSVNNLPEAKKHSQFCRYTHE